MGEIVDFGGTTSLPIPADKVLERAQKAGLVDVIVLGWNEEGTLNLFVSNPSVPDYEYTLNRALAYSIREN